MKRITFLVSISFIILGLFNFSKPVNEGIVKQSNFDLIDMVMENAYLDHSVDTWYDTLTNKQKIAQLIMPDVGSSFDVSDVEYFLENDLIGGFMILNKNIVHRDIEKLKKVSKIPILVSMDAEPSLMQYRTNILDIDNASDFDTIDKIHKNLKKIADYLVVLGVNVNFAPVYDNASNTSVIGDRSFGILPIEILPRASVFVDHFRDRNIAPTAKHFPGHGEVVGDTHEDLQTLEGLSELELESFAAAIDDHHVPLMMVGHLAVNGGDYDTDGLPATLSSKIMVDLLRTEMGFRGVVVTDAMNMGAVSSIEDRDILALGSGADIVLMPSDPAQLHADILEKVKKDPKYWDLLMPKIKRILRLKVCLGLELGGREQRIENK